MKKIGKSDLSYQLGVQFEQKKEYIRATENYLQAFEQGSEEAAKKLLISNINSIITLGKFKELLNGKTQNVPDNVASVKEIYVNFFIASSEATQSQQQSILKIVPSLLALSKSENVDEKSQAQCVLGAMCWSFCQGEQLQEEQTPLLEQAIAFLQEATERKSAYVYFLLADCYLRISDTFTDKGNKNFCLGKATEYTQLARSGMNPPESSKINPQQQGTKRKEPPTVIEEPLAKKTSAYTVVSEKLALEKTPQPKISVQNYWKKRQNPAEKSKIIDVTSVFRVPHTENKKIDLTACERDFISAKNFEDFLASYLTERYSKMDSEIIPELWNKVSTQLNLEKITKEWISEQDEADLESKLKSHIDFADELVTAFREWAGCEQVLDLN